MKTKRLNKKTAFAIVPTYPFNFNGTFNKPSHFPSKLDYWKLDNYWQTIRVDDKALGLHIKNVGTGKKPKIMVTAFSDKGIRKKDIEFIKSEVTWRFGLSEDLTEFNKLIKQDKRFAPIFKKWIGMRNSNAHNLYELLIVAVLLQNATIKRTAQMLETLLNRFGTKIKFDKKELFSIWLPKEMNSVTEEALRNLKIGYRAKFIKKLSSEFATDKINEIELRKFSSEKAKEELMKLYGVGQETARILLFEVCHDNGVFDHIAPWQQKIYSMLFYKKELVPVETIQKDIKEQYGSYSMLAVHYIWEDIFWKRKQEHIPWLEKEIRL